MSAEKNLTFSDVFISAISDMESFYKEEYSFKIRHEFNDDSNSSAHASIKGWADDSYIRFSSDCCNKSVEGVTDFFVALIIISHELAHYVNHHNYYASPELEDSRILEAWADRFGMCIFMCLLTFGKGCGAIAEAVNMPSHSGECIDEIGKAFAYMHKYFYNNNSKKYHTPGDRVMHVAAGVNSFLESYWGNLELTRALDVYTRIYTSDHLFASVEGDIQNNVYSDDNWDKIRTIHLKLQNEKEAITLGLKKEYRRFIDTSFIESEVESKAYMKLRLLLAAQQSTMSNFGSSTQQYFQDKFLNALKRD